jgi:hypothetical protein
MKDLLENFTTLSTENTQDLSFIKNEILNTKSVINETSNLIEKKSDALEEKQKQVYGQTKEIEDKMRLLETRDKMLQLSIDRNLYKKKVIYSLFSVILAFVIIMICFYAFFNKKLNVGE